jgi:GR25 family glycosyltransferase involved in LPS biosynthesis
MNQNIPIYCLNLKRATERKEKIVSEWIIKLGFDIHFFECIDRRDLLENKLIYPYNDNLSIKRINRSLSLGEIACATSHCLLIEKLIKDDSINDAIIMEDDVTPLFDCKKYFYQILENGLSEFSDCEVMILHKPIDKWQNAPKDTIFYEIKNHFSKIRLAPWGTQLLYFSNKNAMQLYYDALKQMQYPADFVWNDIFVPRKTLIYCNNPLGFHDNSCNGTTYIGNEYRSVIRKFIK